MLEKFASLESIELERLAQIGELSKSQIESLATIMPDGITTVEMTPEFEQEIVSYFDSGIECLHSDWQTAVNLSVMKGRSPIWDEFITKLQPEYLEAPVDKIQWTEIGEELCNVEELKIEKWQQLSLEERLEVLQRIENIAAAIEHRPACEVKMRKLDSRTNGHFIPNDGITMNTTRMKASAESQESLDKLLETLIHEGRHSYQYYNISTRMVHSSPAQVAQWRENWPNYFDGESIEIGGLHVRTPFLKQTGFKLYYYQPVETDARMFAADTIGYFKAIRHY